jgi:hypothetical protein
VGRPQSLPPIGKPALPQFVTGLRRSGISALKQDHCNVTERSGFTVTPTLQSWLLCEPFYPEIYAISPAVNDEALGRSDSFFDHQLRVLLTLR